MATIAPCEKSSAGAGDCHAMKVYHDSTSSNQRCKDARTTDPLSFFSAFLPASASATPPRRRLRSQQKYQLQYKFQLGEVLRYRVQHATDIRTTIEETTQQAESSSESIKAWKVTDVLPNGEMEFVHVVETVQMSNTRAQSGHDEVRQRNRPKAPRPVSSKPPCGGRAAVGHPHQATRRDHRAGRKASATQVTDDMPITLRLPDEAGGRRRAMGRDLRRRPPNNKSGAAIQVRTDESARSNRSRPASPRSSVEYQILTPVSAFVESNLVERLTTGTVRCFDLAKGRIVSQEHEVDRRILGFAGESSILHHVSRLEERLLKGDERLARKPQ